METRLNDVGLPFAEAARERGAGLTTGGLLDLARRYSKSTSSMAP